jgi:hypothetical protein
VEVLAPRVPRWKPAERIVEAPVQLPVAPAPIDAGEASVAVEAPIVVPTVVLASVAEDPGGDLVSDLGGDPGNHLGDLAPLLFEPAPREPRAAEAPIVAAGEPFDDALSGPMIFVPPPPLPIPPPIVQDALVPMPEPAAPKQRWGAAAAGIAAFAGLATLVIVGAARRDVVVPAAAPAPPALARPAVPPALDPRPSATDRIVEAPRTAATAESAELPSAGGSPPAIPTTSDAATKTATQLTDVRWEPLAGGGTRVVVTLDGAISQVRVRASRITGDSPRLVVRLLGVTDRVRAPWEPATSEVRRIRSGRHDGDGGSEVHLVLDLGGEDVGLARSQVVGGELWLDLAPMAR